MSILDSLSNSVMSSGLKAIGVNKKSRNKFTAGKPSVINSIPVIYGRPGWVMASPVITGYRVDNWQDTDEKIEYHRLCVHHILGEGLMRTPEAFKIEGRLAAYSKKYTEAEANAIGGEPAPYYLNSYTSQFANGWPTGMGIEHRLDTTRDQYNDEFWPFSFNSLAGFISYHNTKLTADRYVNSVPQAEFLPNGIALHDPRIPFDYANSFVYFIPTAGSSITNDAEIRALLPKGEIGGVGRGWYAENIWAENHGSTPAYMQRQNLVYNYTNNNNIHSDLGDSPDNNPALVFLDYMVSGIYGAGIPVSDNSMNHIIAMANYCDELAPTYSGGPTQQQMACNIVIDTENELSEGLEQILKTCRGLIGWVDGQYQLHIPRAGIPVAGNLDSSTIIKRRSLKLGQKSKRLNRVIATYIEPNKGYQENQLVYPPVDSAEDILWRQTEDAGELNEEEINLGGCTNAYHAADLCAVFIRESRVSMTAEYELNLTGLKYTLGDVVRITDPDGAFTDKLFYIRKWQFDFERRVIIIGVREYSDAIYDVLAHPVLVRDPGDVVGVDPMIIPDVTGLNFAPETYNKTLMGQLSWTAVNHSAVTRYDMRVIDPAGNVAWSVGMDSSTLSVSIPFLKTGVYSLEVRARSSVAVGSYTTTSISHNTPAPAGIFGLQLVGEWTGRDAHVEWISDSSEALRRYRIEVKSAGGTVLHTEYASAPQFNFSYDKNITAGLSRTRVISVSSQYDDGTYGTASELTISNTLPAAPTSISTSVLPNDLDISFDVVNADSDLLGTAVEFHKTGEPWQRVDLDLDVRNYSFSLLDSSSDYFLRLVSRDAFGDGDYSSVIAITTPGPISPASFIVEPGVNVATLKITAQAGYVGCDVWVRNRNSAPVAAAPSWTGGDSSVSISQLTSATDYSIYYAPIDKKGVRGALVNIPFTTVKLDAVDLSGLSPWATKLDAADAAWISDKLEGDAIESSKIANLTAAKLTAGLIDAQIGITSGGFIETNNSGYKTGLGVYDINGTIYTLMTANAAGDVTAGITADGILKAKGADIEGRVTITGGSGYAQLDDKPSSLSGINSDEGTKLGGIAAGADVTDYSTISADAQAKADAARGLANAYANAIEIGGVNLVSGSKDSSLNYSYYATTDKFQDFTVVRASRLESENYTDTYKFKVPVLDELEYTVSFFAKSDEPALTIRCYSYSPNTTVASTTSQGQVGGSSDGRADLEVTNVWKRYWITWVQSEAAVDKDFIIGRLINPGGVAIAGVKLEAGSKATSWSPSVKDVEVAYSAYSDANKELALIEAAAYANTNFVDHVTYATDLQEVRDQIDKSITTWFFNGPPSLTSEPVTDWATDTDKDVHLGDLYYDNATGYAYRFKKEFGTYSWLKIADADLTKALADAAKAQDTADSKRRVFFDTPVPKYDKGDLWDTGNGLKRAATSSTTTFNAGHWVWASDAHGAASAAQVAAIAAAQAKAELAETNAKSYADGIVTAEEQRAINDAQAKADLAEQAAIDAAAIDATNKVDSIEIGGRNLAIEYTNELGNMSLSDHVYTQVAADSATSIYIQIQAYNNGAYVKGLHSFSASSFSNVVLSINPGVEFDSIRIKFNGVSRDSGVKFNNEKFSIDTEYTISFDVLNVAQGSLAFGNVKLEKGNKATDWSPAPEDVEQFATDQAIEKADAAQQAAISAATDADLVATKTTIDGGLITTGGITLDGTSGYIKAGKLSFTDMTNAGLWLGQTSQGGAINVGNVDEYLYFRGDTGLRLKTTDLEIGAGGAATFSGGISMSDDRFRIARAGYNVSGSIADINAESGGGLSIVQTSPIPVSGSVYAGLNVVSTGLPGIRASLQNTDSEMHAVSGLTTGTGSGVYGHSYAGAAGEFLSYGSRTSKIASGVKITTSGCPHLILSPNHSGGAYGYVPYGDMGSVASILSDNGSANLASCYEDTADGKGKWGNVMLAGSMNGGSAANVDLPGKFEYGAVSLGSNDSTSVTLPKKVLVAFSSTKWKGGDESDGSAISWSGNTISIRNSSGNSQTVMYLAITI